MSEKLLKWTKKRWQISLSQKPGQKTFLETKSIDKQKLLENEKKGEIYKKFKDLFSDGELIEVSEKD